METFLLLILLGFLASFLGLALRIGYGAILAPLLMLIGIDPKAVILAVLISQIAGETLSGFFHHLFGTVNFSRNSNDTKRGLLLGVSSIFGFIGATLAVKLGGILIKIYTGMLIVITGFFVLFYTKNVSNGKVASYGFFGIGCMAALNKAITGGSYSATVLLGSTVLGMDIKKTIAVLSMAETFVCVASIVAYLIWGVPVPIDMIIPLTIGAVLATVPVAKFVRRIPSNKLRRYSGTLLVLLGMALIYSTVI